MTKYHAPEKGAQYPKAILDACEARRRGDAKRHRGEGATKQGAGSAEQTGHGSPGCGTKIAIIGAPSTGKTVLARRLTNTLSLMGYNADTAIEYARTYLFRYIKPVQRSLQDPLDQVMIYLGQKRREEDLQHCDFVVCDSATFLPFVFACFWGYDLKDPRDVMVVHKLFKWSLQEITSYAFIFHLPPNLEYAPRKRKWKTSTGDERADVAGRIEGYLVNAKVPYHSIESTSPEEREQAVLDVLEQKVEGFGERRAKLAQAR